MSISLRNRTFTDFDIDNIFLRRLVGAYELVVYGRGIMPSAQEFALSGSIEGAEVLVGPPGSNPSPIGMARPRKPLRFSSTRHQQSLTAEFVISLLPIQLEAIERLRNGQDLHFELKLKGLGSTADSPEEIYDTLRKHIPRSEWVERLRQAHAHLSLVLETPLPLGDASDDWEAVRDALQRAEAAFRGGQYPECVAGCRTVLEAARRLAAGTAEFPSWKDLENRVHREELNKFEREGLIWKAVEHYLHPPHHAPVDGRPHRYSRAEANMTLVMTASLISRLHQP